MDPLQRAQDEARALGCEGTGTEHLLIGLVREGSINAELVALGLDGATIIQECLALFSYPRPPRRTGDAPFSPRVLHVFEMAGEGARPGQLLVALMREPEGGAFKVLAKLGATLERVRAVAT